MLDDPKLIQELTRRFREMNPELMAQPSSHEPKHGMGLLGRPYSADRLKLEKISRNLLISTYKREGLIYASNRFEVSRWAMTRTLSNWGVTLNGGFTINSLRRFSQRITIIRRSQPRQIARSLKLDVIRPAHQYYPYITGPVRDEHRLVVVVNEAVPKGIPDDIRADICQDILVALLDHQIEIHDLSLAVPEFIKRQYRLFPTKYAPLSLDVERGEEGEGFTLKDTLHEGNIRQRW